MTPIAALAAVLLAASSAASSAAAPAPPTRPAALADLDRYVGRWRAEQKMESGPSGVFDLSYEWVLGGRFMSTHAVSRAGAATVESRGYLGLDADGTLTSWTFLDNGSMSVTRCVSKPGTDTLVFEASPTAARPGMRVGFVFEGPDTYRLLLAPGGGAWMPQASMAFRRVTR
jgi:hypothetical protein